jgi:DNA uptake protein ComE-like DNA-binding protein
MQEVSQHVQSSKDYLYAADASTLQRELAEIGEAKVSAIVAYRETIEVVSPVDEALEVMVFGADFGSQY